MSHVTKTSEELRMLAMEMITGAVFTDWMIPEEEVDIIPSVFLPLALMTPKEGEEFIARKPFMLYEHMSKANEMGVNGYPTFMSLQIVTEDEIEILKSHLAALRED